MSRYWRIAIGYFLLIAVILAIFVPLISNMHYISSDYRIQAPRIADNLYIKTHILHPLLVRLVYVFLLGSQNINLASVIVASAFHVLIAIIQFYLFYRAVDKSVSVTAIFWMVFFSLATILATPVSLFTMPINNMVWGYMGMSHHNPTIVGLKMFVMPLLLLCVGLFNRDTKLSSGQLFVWLASLTMISLLTKPNFVLALMPAVVVFGIYRYWRHEYVNVSIAIQGLVIPAFVMLGFQYLVQYYALNTTGSGVAIAPLAALNFVAEQTDLAPYANRFIWFKIIMSCLFPLVIYLRYLPAAHRDLRFNFAWFFFWMTVVFHYGLTETGPAIGDGNFMWTGEVGFFALFTVASVFFVEQNKAFFTGSWREGVHGKMLLLWGIFSLHLISGVIWYVFNLKDIAKYFG